MGKNRIALRLFLYFFIAMILLSVLIAAIFSWSYSAYAVAFHQRELEGRARRIASSFSELMRDERGGGNGRGQGAGYGAYLRFIDDIAMADVWLVDAQSSLITGGRGASPAAYKDLPEDAEAVIAEVLGGRSAASQSFSDVLGSESLTYGVPINDPATGEIIGAVLLHSPVDGIDEAHTQQRRILLVSVGLSLLITVPLSLLLSRRFTRPLGAMKQTAQTLAAGDFAARNQIPQQDEIGDLARSIDALGEQLQKASLQRDAQESNRRAFFANVSHELRTPITVLRGSVEALRDGVYADASQVRDTYQLLLTECIQMQRLVDDLLELSKLQNADFQLDMEPILLPEVLRDAARSMQTLAAERGIEILSEIQLDDATPLGDYGRLRQLFMIILSNAIKFSPPQGRVLLRYDASLPHTAIVSIVDNGNGIAPEELPYLFDRFQRSRAADNAQGSGLGLAIAKEITLRHGAEIDIESGTEGTTVRLLFPIDGR